MMGSPVNRGESCPLPIRRLPRELFDAFPTQQFGMRPRFATFKRKVKNRHDCDQWLMGRALLLDPRPGVFGVDYGIEWYRIEIVD
jgi:hypothetical protein